MAVGTQPSLRRQAASDPLDERVRRRTASLDPLFNPASLVVIADSTAPRPAAVNILSTVAKSGFAGKLFAVGLDRAAADLRLQSYPNIKAIPPDIDLAVLAVSADRLLEHLSDCAAAGVKGAVIALPSGEREGSQAELHSRVQRLLRGRRMRVVGPNCSVLMNPSLGLNVSCAAPLPLGGTVAFISQSGAICHAVLEGSFRAVVGFSAFLSIGGMVDVDWGDLLDYFGADPNTRSILIFMESIANARSFLSAAREVALNKPIMVVKAGRSAAAARIIAAHTGSPAGNDDVLDAAFRRIGVLRLNTVAELFSMADVLSKEPQPRGPRLGIVSNAAGLSALAADSVAAAGCELPPLSDSSCDQLGRLLQSPWRAENPVHVPAEAQSETYAQAARIVLRDPNCDGLLLLTAPEGMSDPGKPSELLVDIENPEHKPILACGMGLADAADSQPSLARACIPTFSNPHLAARAFGCMWQYACNLSAIYETPMCGGDLVESGTREEMARMIAAARASGRTELTESESRYLLAAYGIHTSEKPTADACLLRVASWIDPQFGPVLLFGAGGPLAEALNDRAIALPPLTATLAERMVEGTRVYHALKTASHGRFDPAPLLSLIVRFSQLVIEQPWIREVDINPVLLSPDGCIGTNARVAVHEAEVVEQQLPRPAIRPYPVQYALPWQTRRGDWVTIRPIHAEDEPLMVKFHERLSDYSVYLRYFQMIGLCQRTQHDRLTRICFIDYDREMALVAEHRDPQTGERRIVGLANLGRVRGRNEGEVAALVSDDFQGHGLGTELMRRLIQVARAEKMERVVGSTMLENRPTVAMLKRVGFQVSVNFEDRVVEGAMEL